MQIPLKKKSYSQRYRKEWEDNPDFKGWLAPVQGTDLKGMCRWCQAEFYAKISDIKKHSECKKHKLKAEIITKQKPLPPFLPTDKIKPSSRAEAAMALFIAEHCSVVTVEHLGEMCKKIFNDSKCGHDIHIHRTKCSEIINEVLGPHFKETLRLDIDDQKYSLILDETTDISVLKYLGIAIRYFSNTQNKVLSTFLALTPLTKTDAEGLAEAIINTLNNNHLKLKNLVGIGTDNAAVMTGVNNGLHQILKTKHGLPNLVLVRCVCHSLQLAVSHASEKTLPRNIEYIIRETYNWFSLSPKRQDEYRQIYETINCGSQPLKILKMCTTRWLSIFPAVNRILLQWDELKLHFSLCKIKENCYTAELLHAMFEDGSNLLYMTYIQSILGKVQTALKVFESENPDPTKLLDSLTFLLRSICNIVIYTHININVLTTKIQEKHLNPYATLGYVFETSARKLNLNEDVTNQVKQRCVDFTVKLIRELQSRLPPNIEILIKMNKLSVSEVLRTKNQNDNIIDLAKELGVDNIQKLEKIDLQWNNINFVKWQNINSTLDFWAEVNQYKDAADNKPFQELCDLALTVISLPHSNAEIERIFSAMNITKSKLRNRMCLKSLNSILMIKYSLRRTNKSCYDYEIPIDVLKNIGTNKSYSFAKRTSQPQPSTSGINSCTRTETLTIPDFEIISDSSDNE